MINVKDEVYAALLSVTDNVTDSYPKDWEKDLAIQYMEEDNNVFENPMSDIALMSGIIKAHHWRL